MRMEKMITPSGSAWPNGARCFHCRRKLQAGEPVLAGRCDLRGTVAFHKGCLIALTRQNWPESLYDEIRQSIIDNPEQVLSN